MIISFREKEYMYSYQKIAPPKLQMHLHKYYEFLYIKGGDASYMVEDKIYKAKEGDLFITRPDELHSITFHSDKTYERYFVQISKSFLSDIDVDLLHIINSREAGTMNRIPADVVKRYRLNEYFSKIEPYIVNRVPESNIMIKTFMIQMLVKINSALQEYTDESTVILKDNRITEIKKYIDEHITDNISLDTICKNFYITKYYLCHIFKEFTGLTVKEYIQTRRIAMSKQLIANGQNITELCFLCGFNDYSTFYKTFKKLTGKSPRSFFKKRA